MSRAKLSTVLALLAFVTFSAGCTRDDPTAPSETPPPALDEHLGGNN
jgi:hypothetical protein